MRTIIKIAIGFGLALIGAVIIHATVLNKKTDVYSVAYCAPQAIVSPIFILNSGYYSEGLYHKKRIKLERSGRQVDRSEIHSSTIVQGALISAIMTGLFWLPFFILRSTKKNSSPDNSKQ
jgi:hypothetical protein